MAYDFDKLYKAATVCYGSKDLNCPDCPYGADNCDQFDADMLSLMNALKEKPQPHCELKASDAFDILTALFNVRGRLDTLWTLEKDELHALAIEECVSEFDVILDKFRGIFRVWEDS